MLTFRVGSEGVTIQLDESSGSTIIGAHVKKKHTYEDNSKLT